VWRSAEPLADLEDLLGRQFARQLGFRPVAVDRDPRRTADRRSSTPVVLVGLLGIRLELGQTERAEQRILAVAAGVAVPVHVRRTDGERHEVAPLADRVGRGSLGRGHEQHRGEEALTVRGGEAVRRLDLDPAGLGRPAKSFRRLLHLLGRRLELTLHERRDLLQKNLQHLDRLRIGRAVARTKLAVEPVRREQRPVGVRERDALQKLHDPRLLEPTGVLQQPNGQ